MKHQTTLMCTYVCRFLYVSNLGKYRVSLVANDPTFGVYGMARSVPIAMFCPGVLAAKRLQRYIRLRMEPGGWDGGSLQCEDTIHLHPDIPSGDLT